MRPAVKRAWAAWQLRRPEEAIRLARLALASHPDDPDGHFVLARALYATRQAKEALEGIGRAMALAPRWADPLVLRSDILAELGDLPGALAAADDAARLNPGLASAHVARALRLRALKRHTDAVAAADEAVRLDPENPTVLGTRGDISLGDEPAEAERFYRKSLAIDPRNAWVLNNLGVALYRQGRRDEAAMAYRRALEADATLVVARNNLRALEGSPPRDPPPAPPLAKVDPPERATGHAKDGERCAVCGATGVELVPGAHEWAARRGPVCFRCLEVRDRNDSWSQLLGGLRTIAGLYLIALGSLFFFAAVRQARVFGRVELADVLPDPGTLAFLLAFPAVIFLLTRLYSIEPRTLPSGRSTVAPSDPPENRLPTSTRTLSTDPSETLLWRDRARNGFAASDLWVIPVVLLWGVAVWFIDGAWRASAPPELMHVGLYVFGITGAVVILSMPLSAAARRWATQYAVTSKAIVIYEGGKRTTTSLDEVLSAARYRGFIVFRLKRWPPHPQYLPVSSIPDSVRFDIGSGAASAYSAILDGLESAGRTVPDLTLPEPSTGTTIDDGRLGWLNRCAEALRRLLAWHGRLDQRLQILGWSYAVLVATAPFLVALLRAPVVNPLPSSVSTTVAWLGIGYLLSRAVIAARRSNNTPKPVDPVSETLSPDEARYISDPGRQSGERTITSALLDMEARQFLRVTEMPDGTLVLDRSKLPMTFLTPAQRAAAEALFRDASQVRLSPHSQPDRDRVATAAGLHLRALSAWAVARGLTRDDRRRVRPELIALGVTMALLLGLTEDQPGWVLLSTAAAPAWWFWWVTSGRHASARLTRWIFVGLLVAGGATGGWLGHHGLTWDMLFAVPFVLLAVISHLLFFDPQLTVAASGLAFLLADRVRNREDVRTAPGKELGERLVREHRLRLAHFAGTAEGPILIKPDIAYALGLNMPRGVVLGESVRAVLDAAWGHGVRGLVRRLREAVDGLVMQPGTRPGG